MPLSGREDVEFDSADEQRVGRLLGPEALQVILPGGGLSFNDLAAGERRGTDIADLALLNEVAERAEGLLDVHRRVGPVHLVEVDPVGTEPS